MPMAELVRTLLLRTLLPGTAAAALALAGAAGADPLAGTWITPRDGKGIAAHIEVTQCGAASMCGTIARTYDADGRLVHTRNLGVQVFWDMVPAGQAKWQGWAYVPLYKKKVRGQIDMRDRNHIKVGGCIGPVCRSQDWRRVW